MRYDRERDIIGIDLYEFVSTARRRISPLPSYDADEPEITEGSAQGKRLNICRPFKIGGRSYELYAGVRLSDSGEIVIERTVSSSAQRPRKEETAQIRGEGYISAYAYLKHSEMSCADILFTYISKASGERVEKRESASLKKLESFFHKCAEAVSVYALPEIERVTERLPSLSALKFPYANIREAQRDFISSAYRALSRGGRLYASAPTGTGKTVSALYPALRGMGNGRYDKVFYLTPKTTAGAAAADCVKLMSSQGAKIKAVVLSAKDRCCTEGRVCKMSRKLCKNSKTNSISEAALYLYGLGLSVADEKDFINAAAKYTVCPYELSLAYSELCDLIICDINYLFDPFVYIKRYFSAGGKYAFLIDEAHNLPERIRSAYSAEITLSEIKEPALSPLLGDFSITKKSSGEAAEELEKILLPLVKEEIRDIGDGVRSGAAHLKNAPGELYPLFSALMSSAEAEIFDNYRAEDEEKEDRLHYLNEYYYKLSRFYEILTRFDDGYEMFIFYEDGSIKLKLFCLDTGRIISERLAKGSGAVLFSATLSPLNYYKATLGGDRSDEALEVESPFDPSQLSVSIMDKISTRFSERDDTLGAVMRVISATISAKRGNYMIFSPSFAYSEALYKRFTEKYPKIRSISQKRSMTRKEKDDFLSEFEKEDKSYLVAFCVMGGIYAEGIDLAGEKLIGAVIVGIGLPGLSYEREAIAAYYEEKYEEGKQYAYIYPGMNRVFQAAGRVIRREDDKGVIVLIDDRFDDPLYKKSLPALWGGVRFLSDAKELKTELDEFWEKK